MRTEIGDDPRSLVEDTFETMAAADGVGLAANQVGIDLRPFVYDCPDEELDTNREGYRWALPAT